jgi:Bacterial Ig domain
MSAPRTITVMAAACALSLAVSGQQTATLRITSPVSDTVVSGPIRIEISMEPASTISAVQSVIFSVDGRTVCTVEKPPFVCAG